MIRAMDSRAEHVPGGGVHLPRRDPPRPAGGAGEHGGQQGGLQRGLGLGYVRRLKDGEDIVRVGGHDALHAQVFQQGAVASALLSNPAWSPLRAVEEGRFYTLDQALYNFKPNARWGEAYEKLAQILYPE